METVPTIGLLVGSWHPTLLLVRVPPLLYLFIGFFPSISTSSSFEGNVGVALYTI